MSTRGHMRWPSNPSRSGPVAENVEQVIVLINTGGSDLPPAQERKINTWGGSIVFGEFDDRIFFCYGVVLFRGKGEGPLILEQPAWHLPRQGRGFIRPPISRFYTSRQCRTRGQQSGCCSTRFTPFRWEK